jgi:hypothetical protein
MCHGTSVVDPDDLLRGILEGDLQKTNLCDKSHMVVPVAGDATLLLSWGPATPTLSSHRQGSAR